MPGHVFIIGAGPGDPGLITLRGAQCLAQSDVVLYDGLINPTILQHARQATLICVGKHGQERIWTQAEIESEILKWASSGKVVARLKGGDPAVFARAAEETEALSKAGVSFEIVPGITAALAAGSYAGIPITHRRHASAVALVTGHQRDEDANDLDWQALAKFPGTLVIYMGVTTVREWTSALIQGGKPTDTPAAIVRRCSWSDQQVVRCKLSEVVDALTPASKMRPPVIVIVGEVANLPETMDWFDRRPLFGQQILVTRPADQADEVSQALQQLGAEILLQPAIEIAPPDDWRDVDQAIDRIREFDWLIFSSRNGVQFFLTRLLERQLDVRALAHCRIAVVGSRTGEALRSFGLSPDLIPPDFTAESLVEALIPLARNATVLSVRANRGRDVIKQQLTASGIEVTEIAAYQNRDVREPDPSIVSSMRAGRIAWTLVTSSAAARSLVRMFDNGLSQTKLVSLSPITSQSIEELGFQAACEAKEATMSSMIESIIALHCPTP